MTTAAEVTWGPVVLLIEDEDSIADLVRTYLPTHGFRVVRVRSGEEALVELPRHPVRLVVLDLGLPGMDGFDVCRELRRRSTVPLVILTARDEEVDRVMGLELGADDYVVKPFSPRELAARLKAVLRRSNDRVERTLLTLGDVVLDRSSREVTVGGTPVELTAKEFDLLAFLMEHPGVAFTRDQLLEQVWGFACPTPTRTIDMHVVSVRRKLDRPDLVLTLRGVGYKARSR